MKNELFIGDVAVGEFITPTIVKVYADIEQDVLDTYQAQHDACEIYTRTDGARFIRLQMSEKMFLFFWEMSKNEGFKVMAKLFWAATVEGCKLAWTELVIWFKSLPDIAQQKWVELVDWVKATPNMTTQDWITTLVSVICFVSGIAFAITNPVGFLLVGIGLATFSYGALAGMNYYFNNMVEDTIEIPVVVA
jgi:hypothetical protein